MSCLGPGAGVVFFHDASYGNIIDVYATLGASGLAGDFLRLGMVVRTGGNAGAQWGVSFAGTTLTWESRTPADVGTTRGALAGATIPNNAILRVRIDKTTGTAQCYINGVEQVATSGGQVDTLYIAEASAAAGGNIYGANAGGIRIPLFETIGLSAPPPTISAPLPTGVIGTTTTATPSCTTNAASGTLHVVLSTSSADISGISNPQTVVNHQVAGGGAAPFSGQSTVSTTTPSVGITGLAAGTTYYYALVQANANGNSNILTGSFTTATGSLRSVTVPLDASAGVPLASTNLRAWTRTTLSGAAVDGGSGGLNVTTDGSGNLALTGLTIAAGAGFVTVSHPSDPLNSHNYPVTFA
jgi:hypothetical protein